MRISLAFDFEVDGLMLFANTEAEVTREKLGGPIAGGFTKLQVFDRHSIEIDLSKIDPIIRGELTAKIWKKFKEVFEENYGTF